MNLPPLASVSDLEIRIGQPVGSLAGEDLARAEQALDHVSSLIRQVAGLSWVEDGESVAPHAVQAVCVRAVARTYYNPEVMQTENFAGAYSYSKTQADQQGYLDERELNIVRKAARDDGGLSGSVVSIRTPSAYYDPVTGR